MLSPLDNSDTIDAHRAIDDLIAKGNTRYGIAALYAELRQVSEAERGCRNGQLNESACKLGSLIASDQLVEDTVTDLLIYESWQNGLAKDDGISSVQATIKSGFKKGMQNPRYPVEDLKRAEVSRPTTGKLTLRKAADIKAEPIDWLWEGVLVKGAISILGGDPGLGKSQASLSIASIISNGDYWPGSKQRAEVGNVIILSMEDSAEHVIVPRLQACDANRDRIHIITTVDDSKQFNLQADIPKLRDAVEELGSVKLIIIDPITAYLGKSDVNNSGDVRSITNGLAALAQAYDTSILMLHHLNKGKDQPAAYRMQGSIAWTGAARTTFVIDRDSQDHDLRTMAPAKNNYAQDNTAFKFTVRSAEVGDGIKTSFVVWENGSHTNTADRVLAEKLEGGDVFNETVEFVNELMKNGRVESMVANKAAKDMHISESTLKRVKRKLGIVGVTDDYVTWYWDYKRT